MVNGLFGFLLGLNDSFDETFDSSDPKFEAEALFEAPAEDVGGGASKFLVIYLVTQSLQTFNVIPRIIDELSK